MAMNYFVLTAIGPDRPGLMATISDYVFARGGNVESSRAATLGGEFAVLMLVSASDGDGATLESQIGKLADAKLACTIRQTSAPTPRGGEKAVPYLLKVHSMDHPGIVQAVTPSWPP